GDERLAAGLDQFADAEDGGEVVAGVGGFPGQVSVVEVEVADEQAVVERGPVDGGRAAAEQADGGGGLELQGGPAGDGGGVGVHGADGGGDGVDESAPGLVDRLGGQILEAQLAGIVGQAVGQVGHRRRLQKS